MILSYSVPTLIFLGKCFSLSAILCCSGAMMQLKALIKWRRVVLYFILFDILPGGNTVVQKKAKKVVVLNSNLGFSVWSLHFHSVSCMCSLIVLTSRLMCLR